MEATHGSHAQVAMPRMVVKASMIAISTPMVAGAGMYTAANGSSARKISMTTRADQPLSISRR